MSDKKMYYGIDWLRTIACFGIVLMHIKANNTYVLHGFVFEKMIPSFTDFVFLFMAISAFGMCCGYYEKVLSGNINWTIFYKKRYLKVLPFFACLVLIDLVFEFSKESFCEVIADVSLLFGLFPNDIKVIGVGWFLGLIFAFYIIFPFFCMLIETKRRAWVMFSLSLVMNYICATYFKVGRTNIVFSLPFFLIGGLIYLYKDEIEKINKLIIVLLEVISIIVYYMLGGNTYCCLLISALMLIGAISINEGYCKPISFISSISMEIYLSHMVIFRVVEKVKLNTIIGNGLSQYVLTVVLVLVGTIIFSYMGHSVINKVIKSVCVNKKLHNA